MKPKNSSQPSRARSPERATSLTPAGSMISDRAQTLLRRIQHLVGVIVAAGFASKRRSVTDVLVAHGEVGRQVLQGVS